MASPEHLLHEAQYAFLSISFGESRDNARNTSRAKALCRKIIRTYPATMEAGQAHELLARLGEEAYSPAMKLSHQHASQPGHHPAHLKQPRRQDRLADDVGLEALNWRGLMSLLVTMPKFALAAIVFAGIFVFGIFGPFIFVPLIATVFLTGPFRQLLKPKQRSEWNTFVNRVNAFIEDKRNA